MPGRTTTPRKTLRHGEPPALTLNWARCVQGRAQPAIELGALRIDLAAGSVTLHGALVRLTGLEFRLLADLASRPGQVVSKGELTEHLYAQEFHRDSNTLEVVVGRLLELDPALIETLRGQGYRRAAMREPAGLMPFRRSLTWRWR